MPSLHKKSNIFCFVFFFTLRLKMEVQELSENLDEQQKRNCDLETELTELRIKIDKFDIIENENKVLQETLFEYEQTTRELAKTTQQLRLDNRRKTQKINSQRKFGYIEVDPKPQVDIFLWKTKNFLPSINFVD